MNAEMDFRLLRSLVERAMGASGHARTGFSTFQWNVAGRCECPRTITLTGRDVRWRVRAKHVAGLGPEWMAAFEAARWLPEALQRSMGMRLTLLLDVACRRCPRCLWARAAKWRAKARAELLASSRTWFATFTLSVDKHLELKWRACSRMSERCSGTFEMLSEADQFRERCIELSPELTRYIKRVRKVSRAPMRYLFVTEKHKSGLPHLHALIHEASVTIPKRLLEECWGLGFTNFKLVRMGEEDDHASYLCKYLTKECATRIRASLKYGQQEALWDAGDPREDWCPSPLRSQIRAEGVEI